MDNVIPIILAGGSGTRLWPLSRKNYPKQFLKLIGKHSLIQESLLRAAAIPQAAAPVIIGSDSHYFILQDHLQEISDQPGQKSPYFILEPCGRNTAPAIAIGALYAKQEFGADAILLVLPADHLIPEQQTFFDAVQIAIAVAKQGFLTTFGVPPTAPKTGYGYIEAGDPLASSAFRIKRFIEKPDLATAEILIQQKNFYWNSGMFVFQAQTYLAELAARAPAIYDAALSAFESSEKSANALRLKHADFSQCPSDSIDYAVMEKTDKAAVTPLHSAWLDLGCWKTVAEASTGDQDHNVISGKVVAQNSRDCLLSSQGPLVAAIGLKDIVVVGTQDAVLVADKAYTQEIKQMVNHLETSSHSDLIRDHNKVYRPWGYYESLATGPQFQVKHIVVNPKAQLSLQLHYHRAEHWVVVAGEAEVVNGDQVFRLYKNQSTYIPKKTKHRLSNPSSEPLHIIEVQSGSYLGEDDIVRFSDIYGRESAPQASSHEQETSTQNEQTLLKK